MKFFAELFHIFLDYNTRWADYIIIVDQMSVDGTREMCSESEADYPCRENLRACRFCDYETYCFPKKAAFVAEDLLPEESGTDFPPDDIYQADFFSPDLFTDSDDGGISF